MTPTLRAARVPVTIALLSIAVAGCGSQPADPDTAPSASTSAAAARAGGEHPPYSCADWAALDPVTKVSAPSEEVGLQLGLGMIEYVEGDDDVINSEVAYMLVADWCGAEPGATIDEPITTGYEQTLAGYLAGEVTIPASVTEAFSAPEITSWYRIPAAAEAPVAASGQFQLETDEGHTATIDVEWHEPTVLDGDALGGLCAPVPTDGQPADATYTVVALTGTATFPEVSGFYWPSEDLYRIFLDSTAPCIPSLIDDPSPHGLTVRSDGAGTPQDIEAYAVYEHGDPSPRNPEGTPPDLSQKTLEVSTADWAHRSSLAAVHCVGATGEATFSGDYDVRCALELPTG